MLYKVTHIGRDGHTHKAHVLAASLSDALDQVDRCFGEARALACIRLNTHTGLRLVGKKHPTTLRGRVAC